MRGKKKREVREVGDKTVKTEKQCEKEEIERREAEAIERKEKIREPGVEERGRV